MSKNTLRLVGSVLFVLYLLQYFLHIKWDYLIDLQQIESYKRWSGLLLFSGIVLQWSLLLTRVFQFSYQTSNKLLNLHIWIGALSPLLFYIHSTILGYAYLFLLSITFFINFLLGSLNITELKSKYYYLHKIWYVGHIILSFIIMTLSLFHIWMVFYFE